MSIPATDDWAAPSTSTAPSVPQSKFPIKDDWEDSDEEVDVERSPAPAPPPPVIAAPPPRAPVPLPSSAVAAAAFQPMITILKRPSSNPSQQPKKDPAEGQRDGFNEREARYREARERIFGAASAEGGSSNSSLELKRQPKGPEDGDGTGFKARSKRKPTTSAEAPQ